ncbi:Acetylpolyamine aminohydrolase [Lacunisphaera limnophila]|uniref:Acetylpolyamine aminohydrolase n=2 Tax=Lacunisphaera limnophila TaxID=1838286 RepID=A0A1D8AT31_9BACT|nr:Acetylpolyamine aminohydrolase [Lacunisphaera limnophila]
MRPEQPARILRSHAHLQAAHPTWTWRLPTPAPEEILALAHPPALLQRLGHGPDLDEDTPYFPGIREHACRAAGAALKAAQLAQSGEKAFSLMRPPGHHATRTQAMGFCYLNSIAIAALHVAAAGAKVAVWDFDAHHGNGTEDILRGRPGLFFASVHQYPGYPGTGTASAGNIANFPVAPHTPREQHLAVLARSWETVQAFQPDLVLVSAGFDAYVGDPITQMSLETADFAELGHWLRQGGRPAAAILEGGYSADLPQLIDAFLSAWNLEP